MKRCHWIIGITLAAMAAYGCIPARLRNGSMFPADPVRPPIVRVRLPQIDKVMTVRGEGRFVISAFKSPERPPAVFSANERVVVRHGPSGLEVIAAGAVTLAEGAKGVILYSEDPDDRYWVESMPYHGALIFGVQNGGKPIIVNRVNLDRYLEGVLTPELGERDSSEFEAVKGQAVTARTYALRHLGQYPYTPYDLKAEVADQLYVGDSQEREWASRAVEETAGEVLTYEGQLIDAYYHSTCGGRTDAIQDVWPKPAKSYLKSVDDDEYCAWSKYWRWTENFSHETLLTNLNAYRKQVRASIPEFTQINNIELMRSTPGGRLQAMTITTPDGLWTILADQTRWALGRPSRPGTILQSANFTLDIFRDKNGHVIGVTARGSGYGHGVGLCQCGMIGLARRGQSYRDILPHYYPGAIIEKVY